MVVSYLQAELSKYGKMTRCDLKQSFAFITFEDERDAEDVLREMQGRPLGTGRYAFRTGPTGATVLIPGVSVWVGVASTSSGPSPAAEATAATATARAATAATSAVSAATLPAIARAAPVVAPVATAAMIAMTAATATAMIAAMTASTLLSRCGLV